MKHISLLAFSAAVLLLAGGCSQRTKAPLLADYLSGEFVYYADAASFYDCATGKRYPVSNEGCYLDAERGYMALNPDGPEQIQIMMRGHILPRPAMEGDTLIPTLVIDTLFGFDRTLKCDPNALLSGMYESETERVKSVLQLRADYTFSEITFASDTSEVKRDGTWGRVSDLELALNYVAPEQQILFQIVPNRQSLVCNNNTTPKIYRRLYLE